MPERYFVFTCCSANANISASTTEKGQILNRLLFVLLPMFMPKSSPFSRWNKNCCACTCASVASEKSGLTMQNARCERNKRAWQDEATSAKSERFQWLASSLTLFPSQFFKESSVSTNVWFSNNSCLLSHGKLWMWRWRMDAGHEDWRNEGTNLFPVTENCYYWGNFSEMETKVLL